MFSPHLWFLSLLALGHAMTSDYATFSEVGSLPSNSEGSLSEHLLVVLAGSDMCAGATSELMAQWEALHPSSRAERHLVLASGSLADALSLTGAPCGQALCLERGTPIKFTPHWHQVDSLFPQSPVSQSPLPKSHTHVHINS